MPRALTPVQQTALTTAQRLIATDPRYNKGAWIKPSYVMAHCEIESEWSPSVHSSDGLGSIGLMQVQPAVAESTGVRGSQASPAVSVETGMRVIAMDRAFLSKRLGKVPSQRQLVMAYNEGAGAVAEGRDDPHYYDAWAKAQSTWAFVDALPAPAAEPAPPAPSEPVAAPPPATGTAAPPAGGSATAQEGASEDWQEDAKALAGHPPAVPTTVGVADQPVLSPGDPGYEEQK